MPAAIAAAQARERLGMVGPARVISKMAIGKCVDRGGAVRLLTEPLTLSDRSNFFLGELGCLPAALGAVASWRLFRLSEGTA
jgi:hypothetical protein